MAKKTKVVEIKSVPTEPQRGSGEGADPNDPVGIYYPVGGIARLIGSLAGGEEDEAVIKTGGTIVEHDINVRYHAESGPSQVTYPVYKRITESPADPTLIKNITQYPGSFIYIENSEIPGSWTFDALFAYDANGGSQFEVPAETDAEGIAFIIPDPNHLSSDPEDGPYSYLEILVDQK